MRKIFLRPSWMVILMILLGVIILAFNLPDASSLYADARQKGALEPEEVIIDISGFDNAEDNEACFQCHGQAKYSYMNTEQDRMVHARMYQELIISRNKYYTSVHRSFACTDCHSYDYTTFPHPGSLRMEFMYTCLDCHGDDELSAPYHFLEIDEEFSASVHSEEIDEEFTCWMCHNPHSYKPTARASDNVQETIIYNNTICLDCHSDYRRFGILTDRKRPNLIESHDWIPNQELHIAAVRCIECHTERNNDSVLVAHKILPKEQAVKNCKECHSTNPELLAQLYQYQASEVRSEDGFFRGITTSDSIVIGASRNGTLNLISLILFGGVVAGVLFHGLLRIIKK